MQLGFKYMNMKHLYFFEQNEQLNELRNTLLETHTTQKATETNNPTPQTHLGNIRHLLHFLRAQVAKIQRV